MEKSARLIPARKLAIGRLGLGYLLERVVVGSSPAFGTIADVEVNGRPAILFGRLQVQVLSSALGGL